MRRLGNIGLDHQIDIEEFGGICIIGHDTANLRGSHDDRIGAGASQPRFNFDLSTEIRVDALGCKDYAVLARKPSQHSGPDHAFVASDPYALAFERIDDLSHVRCPNWPEPAARFAPRPSGPPASFRR